MLHWPQWFTLACLEYTNFFLLWVEMTKKHHLFRCTSTYQHHVLCTTEMVRRFSIRVSGSTRVHFWFCFSKMKIPWGWERMVGSIRALCSMIRRMKEHSTYFFGKMFHELSIKYSHSPHNFSFKNLNHRKFVPWNLLVFFCFYENSYTHFNFKLLYCR